MLIITVQYITDYIIVLYGPYMHIINCILYYGLIYICIPVIYYVYTLLINYTYLYLSIYNYLVCVHMYIYLVPIPYEILPLY